MKLAKIHHCDMHAQNIMIIPNYANPSGLLDFNYLGIDIKIDIGNTLIKVIDFGEGAAKGKICSKRRTTSSSLMATTDICLGKPAAAQQAQAIALESQFPALGDSDLNFFINIVKICQQMPNAEKSLSKIDTDYLTFLSNKMDQGDDKATLFLFFKEISQNLPIDP